MADLDDLLDSKPATATTGSVAGIDEMDDLLGDGPAPSSTVVDPLASALGDDFLLGDSDEPKKATASAPTSAPAAAPTSLRQQKLTIEPLSKSVAGPSLHPFITPTTYFARFVLVYGPDRKRNPGVLAFTNNAIQVITPQMVIDRNVPIASILGVVRQPVLVSKNFGLVKEYEIQMVFQIDGDRDIYLSLTHDEANGSQISAMDFLMILNSLCISFGVSLPVCDLRQEENIESMVKWSKGEDKIRKQLAEALAYRTELQYELQSLGRLDNQLATSIETLKTSTASQASNDLQEEIDLIEKTLSEFTGKLDMLQRSKLETEKLLAGLQSDLQKEELRRNSAVRETMEASTQQELMRQLTEYEIMKAAHKREIDKVAAITSFDERRASSRKPSYSGISQINLRIDDLEEEENMLIEKRTEKGQLHAIKVKALAEAKKRLAQAKSALVTITEEVATLKGLSSKTDPLPEGFNVEPAPTFEPVVPAINDVAVVSSQRATAPSSAPVAPPPAAPVAAKAPIDLDDEDI